MKKLIIAAILMTLVNFVQADMRGTPKGLSESLATSEYGGVDYATSSFSNSVFTVFTTTSSGRHGGVFQGIIIDSVSWDSINEGSSFVSVFDSTSQFVDTNSRAFLQNIYIATNTSTVNLEFSANPIWTSAGSGAGLANISYKPRYPLRIYNGLYFKASGTGFKLLKVLYTKFDK